MFWNQEKIKNPVISEKEKAVAGDSILPAEFQIPDLSYLEKGEETQSEMRQSSEFYFEHRGKKYPAEVTFILINKDGIRPNILAKIDFDIKDVQK